MVAIYPKENEILSFPGLETASFLHPTDAAALSGVKTLKGLDILINTMNKISYEKLFRIQSMGDDVRVTKNTCSEIYQMVEYCANVLDMEIPDVFINQSPFINAFTTGTDSPMIQLYSGIIDYMEDDELLAVIAHEMGHIKCGHVLYHTAASALQLGTELLGPLKILADTAFALTLLEWERKSELSADRAALLVTQDIKPVINVLMKIAGGSDKVADKINYDDFISQSHEFKNMADKLTGRAYKVYLNILRSHPFPVMRAAEIDSWSKSDQYKDVLKKGVPIKKQKCESNNVPDQIIAQSDRPRSIPIAWRPPRIANITGYRIYRSDNPSDNFELVREVSGRETCRFVDKGLKDGKTFYYHIKSIDQYSKESECGETISATTKYAPPCVKTFNLFGNKIREIELSWSVDGLPSESKIEIYRSECDSQKFIMRAVLEASFAYFVDAGLGDGKKYGYYLRVNDEGVQSEPSNTLFASTVPLPAAPENFTVEYNTKSKYFYFKWEQVSDAEFYRVCQKRMLLDKKVLETKQISSAAKLKITKNKEACFYVRSIDKANRESEKSNFATIKSHD